MLFLLKRLWNNADNILALCALCGLWFYLYKILFPSLELKIQSIYSTFLANDHACLLLKLRVDASFEFMVDSIAVDAIVWQNEERHSCKYVRIRWKGFLPKMLDVSGKERYYKLLHSPEPDLLAHTIKPGISDYYIFLESNDTFPKQKVNKWQLEINIHSPSSFIPLFLSRSKIRRECNIPIDKEAHFDDSLIEKISDEEVKEIVESL